MPEIVVWTTHYQYLPSFHLTIDIFIIQLVFGCSTHNFKHKIKLVYDKKLSNHSSALVSNFELLQHFKKRRRFFIGLESCVHDARIFNLRLCYACMSLTRRKIRPQKLLISCSWHVQCVHWTLNSRSCNMKSSMFRARAFIRLRADCKWENIRYVIIKTRLWINFWWWYPTIKKSFISNAPYFEIFFSEKNNHIRLYDICIQKMCITDCGTCERTQFCCCNEKLAGNKQKIKMNRSLSVLSCATTLIHFSFSPGTLMTNNKFEMEKRDELALAFLVSI